MQRGVERGRISSRPRKKDVAFDRAGEKARERVLVRGIGLIQREPSVAPDPAIVGFQEERVAPVRDLDLLALLVADRSERQVRIVEHPEDRARDPSDFTGHRQHLFLARRERVLLLAQRSSR